MAEATRIFNVRLVRVRLLSIFGKDTPIAYDYQPFAWSVLCNSFVLLLYSSERKIHTDYMTRSLHFLTLTVLSLLISGCLTVETKEYHVKLKDDHSGEATIKFINIVDVGRSGKKVPFCSDGCNTGNKINKIGPVSEQKRFPPTPGFPL